MADAQKKEITLDQFAQQMKSDVESGVPSAVQFANSLGDKFGPNGKTPLGRKLTNEEMYSNYVTDHPEFGNLYTVTGVKSAGDPQKRAPSLGGGTSLGGFGKPLAEGVRGPLEKGIGAVTGAIPKLVGAPKGVTDFSTGLGEGLADAGIQLTSPVNLGLMVGSAFIPESALAKTPKVAKLVSAIKTGMKYGFRGSMTLDALGEVAGFAQAYQAGDYKAMGKAAAKALADAYLISETKGGGKLNKGEAKESLAPPPGPPGEGPIVEKSEVTVGGKARPVTSKSYPEHTAAALRAKGPSATEEIGKLQDSLNDLEKLPKNTPGVKDQIEAINGRLKSLSGALKEHEVDPRVREQRQAAGQPMPKGPEKPPPPPGPSAPAGTASELALRSVPVGEPGSSAGRQSAAESAEAAKYKSEATIPPRDSNPDNVQYTVQRLPGVPAGSTIIPRGSVPGKGFMIDVVDPSGKLTQATLPFQDSIANMVRKGWMRKSSKPIGVTVGFKENLEGNHKFVRSDSTFREVTPPSPPPAPSSEESKQAAPPQAAPAKVEKPSQPTAAESNVGPGVKSEVHAVVQKLIDETVTPKGREPGSYSLTKDPWKNVSIQLLDANRKPIAEKSVPASEFTSESIAKWIGEHGGKADMIRISDPDAALKNVRILPLPKASDPKPPAPPGP